MKSITGMNPMTHQTTFRHGPAQERGIALIIGLVILAVLSLIGVAAFSVTTQEERMAGNSRDRIRAFEAAEAALRNCETVVAGGAAFDGTVAGLYTAPLAPSPSNTEQINWSSPPTSAVLTVPTATVTSPEWSQQPICVAEQFQVQSGSFTPGNAVPMTYIAHITAQGYGMNPNTVVKLESYYAM
jgi:type IV pilus assembly protein PilX